MPQQQPATRFPVLAVTAGVALAVMVHSRPEGGTGLQAMNTNGRKIHHVRLGAKPGDHKFLFNWAEWHADLAKTLEIREGSIRGLTFHRFRRLEDAPTDDTHFGGEVTLLEDSETKPDGRTTHWSWMIDL